MLNRSFFHTVLLLLLVSLSDLAQAQIADINSAINKAGRQRMLSQRMAKFYQAAAWKVVGTQLSPEVNKARSEFSAVVQELSVSPNNTQALRDELDLVKQQWIFFENALNQPAGTEKALSVNVATTSERILETMENVVSLYEKISK